MHRIYVDMVRDTLINKFSEYDLHRGVIPDLAPTLDPDLQKAAAQAVEAGIKAVDEQVKAKLRNSRRGERSAEVVEIAGGAVAAGAGGAGGARSVTWERCWRWWVDAITPGAS